MNTPIRPLRVFVSYASEDNQLAIALHHLLETHLSCDFADISIDTESLRAGLDLNDQIRRQLAQTDVLVVVYTGQLKSSHSFTGLEIGFFLAQPEPADMPVKRRVIPFYLEAPPAPLATTKGVRFGIDRATLRLDTDEYEAQLRSLPGNHPIPLVLQDLERDVNAMRSLIGWSADDRYTAERRLASTRDFLRAIFAELRKGADFDYNPQKKLVISITKALDPDAIELPGSAELRPEGAGTLLGIFNIQDQKITWRDFVRSADKQYRNAWKDVIETVVMSSLEKIDVDNSQIIMSKGDGKLYRVILSRSIRFYDDRREFHLYFVEVARRNDFGNDTSTRLLKALGLCCRFRFMFFEPSSEFSEAALGLRSSCEEIREEGRRLLRELNLMQRDAQEARLDTAAAWLGLVDFDDLAEMQELYGPIEQRMRAAIDRILSASHSEVIAARNKLVAAVRELRETFEPRNAKLIGDLGTAVARVPALFPPPPFGRARAESSGAEPRPEIGPSAPVDRGGGAAIAPAAAGNGTQRPSGRQARLPDRRTGTAARKDRAR
jgi:hypothetical protein